MGATQLFHHLSPSLLLLDCAGPLRVSAQFTILKHFTPCRHQSQVNGATGTQFSLDSHRHRHRCNSTTQNDNDSTKKTQAPSLSTIDTDISTQNDNDSAIPSLSTIDTDIFNIAFPTIATLAADPLAALISTAWVGQMGALPLGGVGVALSVYGAFTKLFNMPLLAVITSSTATALGRGAAPGSKELNSAITSGVAIALGIGLFQAVLLGSLGIAGLETWGAGPQSPLYSSAVDYLSIRALGAPFTVLFLALQGVFRGLADTRAPLTATLVANVVNIALEPLFIFTLGWGVKGAATAVVVSQVVAVAGLTGVLVAKLGGTLQVSLMNGKRAVLQEVWQYVKPTGLLTVRTVMITATFSVATAIASRTGASHAAAHQVAFQIWLASSLLSDSLAVAAQSLISRSLAAGTATGRVVAATISTRVINLSLRLGLTLTAALIIGTTALPLTQVFSSDPEVLHVLALIMPAVVALQPLNAIAFTLDGILYAVNGYSYAAQAMAMSAVPAVAIMLVGARWAAETGAGAADLQLGVVWLGLAVVMAGRFLTIFLPLKLRKQPFDKLL